MTVKEAAAPSLIVKPTYLRVRFAKDFIVPADGVDRAKLKEFAEGLRMQVFPACDLVIEETAESGDGRTRFVDGKFERKHVTVANVAALKALDAPDGETAVISDEGPEIYLYIPGLAAEEALRQGLVPKFLIASKVKGVWIHAQYFRQVLEQQQMQMQQAMAAQQGQAQQSQQKLQNAVNTTLGKNGKR